LAKLFSHDIFSVLICEMNLNLQDGLDVNLSCYVYLYKYLSVMNHVKLIVCASWWMLLCHY